MNDQPVFQVGNMRYHQSVHDQQNRKDIYENYCPNSVKASIFIPKTIEDLGVARTIAGKVSIFQNYVVLDSSHQLLLAFLMLKQVFKPEKDMLEAERPIKNQNIKKILEIHFV